MSEAPFVIDVDSSGFERDVIERSREKPVIVDFWAEWCGPCRHLGPILERQAERCRGKFLLAKVDVDREPALAARFGIQSIPTVLAFRNGDVVDAFMGLLGEQEVEAFVSRVIPSEVDDWLEQAREAPDPERASALYRRALEVEPDRPEALAGLGRLLVEAGRDSEARPLLERAAGHPEQEKEARALLALLDFRAAASAAGGSETIRRRLEKAPEDLDLRYDLAAALAAEGRFEEALESFLAVLHRDRSYRDGAAKEAMVHLFYVIGPRSELADRYRGLLARTIY